MKPATTSRWSRVIWRSTWSSSQGPRALLVALAVLFAVPGCEQGTDPAPDDVIAGTLVSRIDLTATHAVEFWQLSDGAPAMREIGTAEDRADEIDVAALAGLSIADRYARLANDARVPPEIRALSERTAEPRDRANTASAPDLGPGQQASSSGSGPLAMSTPDREPGVIRSAVTWDWNADAQWWISNFCSWNQVDSAWCPTNVGWADSGTVWAMYYETSCVAASFDQSAAYFVERWDGTNGRWVNLANTTVAPRYWQKWWFETRYTYHSKCSSIAAGGDSRVHFAHRFRWGTPPISALGDHPFDRTYDSDLSQDMQGITHDATSWYHTNAYYHYYFLEGVTNESHIWRTPVGTDLSAQPSPFYRNPWQGSYNHFGDLSYGAGYLFVALEPGEGGSASWGGVGIFNTALQYYCATYWPWAGESDQGGTSAWVAYNPKDGLLYSSAGGSWINKYSWSLSWTGSSWTCNLGFVNRIAIRDAYGNATSMTNPSGAEFSNSGKLYLASDAASGVYVMDVYNGRLQTYFAVQIDHGSGEELEGLTIWNLDNGAAPGVAGQIHVQLVDNDDLSSDDYYLKHYRASDPSKL